VRCLECGFNYVESSGTDRRLHRRIHDEIVNGLRRSGLRSCPVAWRSGSRSVVVINGQSPLAHRRLAQEVSLVAAGDTEFSSVAYAADEQPDDRQIHLFVGVEKDRAQAYVCFEKRSHVWRCTWQEYAEGVTHRLDCGPIWSIGYAWVSRGNRRTGWMRAIVSAASNHLGFANEFGWYTPFSDAGEAVARVLCPSGIFIAK
jgi:hypothetical protein